MISQKGGVSHIILGSAAYFCATAVFIVLATMTYLAWPLLVSGQFFDILVHDWEPENNIFGIYPMLHTSITLSILALLVSLPISLGTSVVTHVLAPPWLRKFLVYFVQLMAGIPTVVYGFVSIFLLVPIMREYITMGSGMSLITASFVLGLLIAPTMIVLFTHGFTCVPQKQILALDALGIQPIQKVIYLLIPGALPAILSGIILGFGRALGDTLISLMLAGNAPIVPEAVTDSGRSLTSHIALVIAADFDSLEFKTIFACGIVLYILTSTFIIIARKFTAKRRNAVA